MSDDAVVVKKGGMPVKGTPAVVEAPPVAAQPAIPVTPVAFDRKSYQREYMRKYREAGRDRSRKTYKGAA